MVALDCECHKCSVGDLLLFKGLTLLGRAKYVALALGAFGLVRFLFPLLFLLLSGIGVPREALWGGKVKLHCACLCLCVCNR